MHIYEIRPRKDRRGFDLISDRLPFGRLWYLNVATCGRSTPITRYTLWEEALTLSFANTLRNSFQKASL
jgi:hypothetical protein